MGITETDEPAAARSELPEEYDKQGYVNNLSINPYISLQSDIYFVSISLPCYHSSPFWGCGGIHSQDAQLFNDAKLQTSQFPGEKNGKAKAKERTFIHTIIMINENTYLVNPQEQSTKFTVEQEHTIPPLTA